MKRRRCVECPHVEYLHDDRATPTGLCMVDGCHPHAFALLEKAPPEAPSRLAHTPFRAENPVSR